MGGHDVIQEQRVCKRLPARVARGAEVTLCVALAVVSSSALASAKSKYTIIDVPGATETSAAALNAKGWIAGTFASGNNHGFVRSPGGTFATFDGPGASNTSAGAINAKGAIAGNYDIYTDNQHHAHGLLRTTDGTITSIDAPDAGQGDEEGTLAYGINSPGAIAGYYIDSNNLIHGYVRDTGGNYTEFDPPGSAYTYAVSINNEDDIAGYYSPPGAQSQHSFVRTPDGTIATFDPPGTTGSSAVSINTKGALTGSCLSGTNWHGYVRAADGVTYTQFDAATGNINTYPQSINAKGSVAGYYEDFSTGMLHGFVRAPNGKITVLDPPGTVDTQASAVNARGAVAGYFIDGSGVEHGFVWSKKKKK